MRINKANVASASLKNVLIAVILLIGPGLCCAAEQNSRIGVYHENDPAQIVLLHEPGSELFYGLLHPAAALFQASFDAKKAVMEHRRFRELLSSMGLKTYLVEELLVSNTKDNDGHATSEADLQSLKRLAEHFLKFDKAELEEQLKKLQSKARAMEQGTHKNELLAQLDGFKLKIDETYLINYKRNIIDALSPKELIRVIFERPTLRLNLSSELRQNKVHLSLGAQYHLSPVMNLYFARDPLITTSNGVVLGRMAEYVRQPEVDIMGFILRKLNISPVYKVQEPGVLEGGDFLPAGKIVFQGIGLRTNFEAVKQLLIQDAYGAEEIVVVKDLFDQNMDRMHLDTIFNIVGKSHVLLWEDVLTNDKMRRLVDVYARRGKTKGIFGPYEKIMSDKDFGEFLRERKFQVIKVTDKEQKLFAVNVLNVGNGTIITPYNGSDYSARLSEAGIKAVFVDFENLRRGWGAAHCMTQVISRAIQGPVSLH
jgi:arginine deiminase